nr:hypothetical protein [Anoxybacillus pushchinoensis]
MAHKKIPRYQRKLLYKDFLLCILITNL